MDLVGKTDLRARVRDRRKRRRGRCANDLAVSLALIAALEQQAGQNHSVVIGKSNLAVLPSLEQVLFYVGLLLPPHTHVIQELQGLGRKTAERT